MAATCLDIITDAMKLAGILRSGGSPKAAEADDGMVCLQALYDEWIAGGMFGKLTNCYLTADTDAQEGYRYYVPAGVTLTAATNDYVPQYGDSYSECDYASGIGYTRQPRDLALYEVVDSTGSRSVKLYDRTQWVDLLDLTTASISPLASRGRTGLAAALATSGAFLAMFGVTPNPATVVKARQFTGNLMNKSGSTQDDPPGTYY